MLGDTFGYEHPIGPYPPDVILPGPKPGDAHPA